MCEDATPAKTKIERVIQSMDRLSRALERDAADRCQTDADTATLRKLGKLLREFA